MLKINPGKSTVWLRPDTLQIGLEADAVIVGGLTPAHQRFIRALSSGIADNQVGVMARSTRIGVAEAERLIDRLSGVLVGQAEGSAAAGERKPSLSVLHEINPDFAELIRVALLCNVDGVGVIAHRAARLIHLESLDKTGVSLLRGFANAGFAQFWSSDRETVGHEDTQALGFPKEQIGRSRLEGAQALAMGFANPVSVASVAGQRPRVFERVDLSILVANQVIEPRRYKTLVRYGVPHIAITFDETGVRVSPLIIPNKTPCLGCLDLAMTQIDADHSVRITQLAHATQRYDDSSAVLFSAAMAVASATEFLDSQQGFAHQNFERLGWQFERSTGRVLRIDWPALPGCECFKSRTASQAVDPLGDFTFEHPQESRWA